MKNIKHLFTINLLSIMGYLYLAYCVFLDFYKKPIIMNNTSPTIIDIDIMQGNNEIMYLLLVKNFILVSFFIFIGILFLVSIECILRKKNIIPELKTPNNKIYKTSFIIGLILQLTPILYLFLIFIFPIVRYNLMNN